MKRLVTIRINDYKNNLLPTSSPSLVAMNEVLEAVTPLSLIVILVIIPSLHMNFSLNKIKMERKKIGCVAMKLDMSKV